MSRTLDFVLVGCGSIARMHARLLRKLPGVRLHFASRDADKARDYARRFGGGRAFGSYAEAYRADGIDAAVILTPPAQHRAGTLGALAGGKAVVVEKPAFPEVRTFQEIREASQAAGRPVFVAENYFYKPLTDRLRRVLEGGLVGDPLFLQVNAVKRQRATGWRADSGAVGGGGLLEGGIHWINFMASLGLHVEEVSGFPVGGGGGEAAEDSAVVIFRYAGGAVGTLAFSWEVPSALHGVRMSTIFGREGTVRFESNGLFVVVTGKRTRAYLPGFFDLAGYRAMWSDFVDALRSDRAARMTLEMAERDVRIVQRVYDSNP